MQRRTAVAVGIAVVIAVGVVKWSILPPVETASHAAPATAARDGIDTAGHARADGDVRTERTRRVDSAGDVRAPAPAANVAPQTPIEPPRWMPLAPRASPSSEADGAGPRIDVRPTRLRGWSIDGPNAEAFTLDADETVAWHGARSARLQARVVPGAPSFAGLLQTIDATPYRNRRVRFVAYLQTRGSAGATVALGAGDANGVQLTPKFMLVNARREPLLRGTAPWRPLRIVVDVPAAATTLQYGAFLFAPGTLWIDAASLDVIDVSEPPTQPPLLGPPFVTAPEVVARRLPAPDNMDFEAWD